MKITSFLKHCILILLAAAVFTPIAVSFSYWEETAVQTISADYTDASVGIGSYTFVYNPIISIQREIEAVIPELERNGAVILNEISKSNQNLEQGTPIVYSGDILVVIGTGGVTVNSAINIENNIWAFEPLGMNWKPYMRVYTHKLFVFENNLYRVAAGNSGTWPWGGTPAESSQRYVSLSDFDWKESKQYTQGELVYYDDRYWVVGWYVQGSTPYESNAYTQVLTYSASASYSLNQIVVYNGTPYRVSDAVKANETAPGSQENSGWNRLDSLEYDGTNTYMLHDAAYYDGKLYQVYDAVLANQNEPANSTGYTGWNHVNTLIYQPYNVYRSSDYVIREGYVYQSLQDHNDQPLSNTYYWKKTS